MKFIADLLIGEWDERQLVPPIEKVIDANLQLKKAKFFRNKRSINCVLLNIRGTYIPVHLEKTFCTECGYTNGWCAIPDRSHVKRESLIIFNQLDHLPCEECGTTLLRCVLWKEGNGT